MGIPETRPNDGPRKRTWPLALAVLLAIGGLQYLSSGPDPTDWDVQESLLSPNPFPAIPDGKAGAVSLVPCGDGMDCGYVITPKDYFDEEVGTAAVAIARLRAPSGYSKGSIFINPGGPGGSGVDFLMGAGPLLHQLVGDDWDLVGFDPRGIGRTRPLTKCFPDDTTEMLFLENTVLHQGWTVPNTINVTDPVNKYVLTVQARQFLAIKEAQAQLCHENMDVKDLAYMGTASVVRDIDFMTRVLDGEEAKIHFLGFSYGTIVGALLVNMLPDRIGRAVIDGVVDPVVWFNQPSHEWHKYWSSSSEAAYQWYLKDCAKAGPKQCALAKKKGEDPAKIEKRVERFIQDLVTRPLAATARGRPGYITSGGARGILFFTISVPSLNLYPHAAEAFAQAMGPARNGTLLLDLLFYTSAPQELSRLAVVCADTPDKFAPPTAEDIADEFMWGLANTSKHFGAAMDFTEHDGGCEFWPKEARAPEKFAGPWNASLEYPLLIVSNTADPDTPLANGLVVNKLMGNSSTLLIQNGPGHCSIAVPSLCTIKAQLAYWAGEPPKNGTLCELSGKTFPDDNETAVRSMSVEDGQLLKAARRVSGVLNEMRKPGLAPWRTSQ